MHMRVHNEEETGWQSILSRIVSQAAHGTLLQEQTCAVEQDCLGAMLLGQRHPGRHCI